MNIKDRIKLYENLVKDNKVYKKNNQVCKIKRKKIIDWNEISNEISVKQNIDVKQNMDVKQNINVKQNNVAIDINEDYENSVINM